MCLKIYLPKRLRFLHIKKAFLTHFYLIYKIQTKFDRAYFLYG
ncbi:hypothetical protein CHAB381_1423 [Campylobacter hominis ATCC BAA-381]|uniref:Uncharacterized protein n=1 Tax=Campylobacter hominis (strain ATCC BAA-381 / DSM 21671 / CCUG 45161 / LMG 19568 / NCTC 13146 / CH001A) TaxID=360107 RepID=A7I375_CAMHC|nr:hypothetical protein CHAB381_1423 [Campylobacter hominis ATCC BAA-381]